MKFHVFYTDNMPHDQWGSKMINDQKSVFDHFGLEIEYIVKPYVNFTQAGDDHGKMVTDVIKDSEGVICFMDLDCLPHDIEKLQEIYNWVEENKSFAGNAQNISHIPEIKDIIFAAPSTLMVHKDAWVKLGSPDMAQQHRSSDGAVCVDVAQQLTLNAIEQGFDHKILHPEGCDMPQWYTDINGKIFTLGIGTAYPASWHYFQGSINLSQSDLWDQRVSGILNNEKLIPAVEF